MVAAVSKPFVSPSSTPSAPSPSPREVHARIAALYARLHVALVRDARSILPRARHEAEDAVQDALIAVLAAGIASEEALRAATRRAAMIRSRNGRERATAKYEIARGAEALDLFDKDPGNESFDDVDDV